MGGAPVPDLTQAARSSLDNVSNQINQAITTRNTGQLVVYGAIGVVVVIVLLTVLHILIGLLPLFIIIGLIALWRRNRGVSRRRW